MEWNAHREVPRLGMYPGNGPREGKTADNDIRPPERVGATVGRVRETVRKDVHSAVFSSDSEKVFSYRAEYGDLGSSPVFREMLRVLDLQSCRPDKRRPHVALHRETLLLLAQAIEAHHRHCYPQDYANLRIRRPGLLVGGILLDCMEEPDPVTMQELHEITEYADSVVKEALSLLRKVLEHGKTYALSGNSKKGYKLLHGSQGQ